MSSEMIVARMATVSEVVRPVRMRAKMSRPVPGLDPERVLQAHPPAEALGQRPEAGHEVGVVERRGR